MFSGVSVYGIMQWHRHRHLATLHFYRKDETGKGKLSFPILHIEFPAFLFNANVSTSGNGDGIHNDQDKVV